jgi:hypothetical protein
MSPVQHRVSGAALSFSLDDEMQLLREELQSAGAHRPNAGQGWPGKDWPLHAGELLALDGGVTHAVNSATGGIFLLTVMHATLRRRAPREQGAV